MAHLGENILMTRELFLSDQSKCKRYDLYHLVVVGVVVVDDELRELLGQVWVAGEDGDAGVEVETPDRVKRGNAPVAVAPLARGTSQVEDVCKFVNLILSHERVALNNLRMPSS